MNLVALTGEMYSGKSTIAQGLEDKEYMLLSFTDVLKGYAAEALTSIGYPTNVAHINMNKKTYRTLLQGLGEVIGFSTDPGFIVEALEPWIRGGCSSPAVFDNVRTVEQWEVLRTYGFQLVSVQASGYQRVRRAEKLGVTVSEFTQAEQHPIEQNGTELTREASLILDGTWGVDQNIEKILNFTKKQAA